MIAQNRKNFFKTLGVLGAGTLLSGFNSVVAKQAETPGFLSVSATGKRRILRVAHLTDIHVQPGAVPEKGMAAAFHYVNGMTDRPDLVINGGDAIMNAVSLSRSTVKAQWDTFHKVLAASNSLDIYHCIGNHDLYGWALPDQQHEKRWALDEYKLDRNYYAFEKNGWKFIVLDSIHARKSVPGYYGKLDEEQLEWLENELKNTGSSTYICIVSHIPILAVCSLFDTGGVNHSRWSIPDNCLHADAQKLRDLFFTAKNVKACLSGHIHLIDHVNYLGTDYYCNGAVSGGWWKGDYQHFSPALAVMNFYEDGSTTREIHHYDWNA